MLRLHDPEMLGCSLVISFDLDQIETSHGSMKIAKTFGVQGFEMVECSLVPGLDLGRDGVPHD